MNCTCLCSCPIVDKDGSLLCLYAWAIIVLWVFYLKTPWMFKAHVVELWVVIMPHLGYAPNQTNFKNTNNRCYSLVCLKYCWLLSFEVKAPKVLHVVKFSQKAMCSFWFSSQSTKFSNIDNKGCSFVFWAIVYFWDLRSKHSRHFKWLTKGVVHWQEF